MDLGKIGSIVYVVVVMAFLLPIALVGGVVVYMMGMKFLLPLIIVAYLIVGTLMVMSFFPRAIHKKLMNRIMIGAIALAVVAAIPGIYHYTRPVVQDGYIATHDYAPFQESTKAVSLDEPATLKLEDDLPILDGATALYPIYSAFAQAVYPEKEYNQYDSEVMSNRTGEAYDNLFSGRADIIFVSGPSKAQLAKAEEMGKDMKLTPIGREAFVFFVNARNPVKSLTTDELKGIYSGQITNWKEVGGKRKSIRAFQRPEDSGSQTALQHFMGDVPIMDPPVEDIASFMGTIIDQVSDYKNYNNAIGYTFRYYSTQMVKNSAIRLLQVDGVEPTVETIRSGEYPLTDEFYAVTAGSDNPHIESFLEWIVSEQGQDIVEKTGYVPVSE
ncbi:substrate-binding domain-containing protein [Sporosarcina sp. 179-K 3D1 HS]|uniref:PstS family phosphate ABC transporter substrate-binding protein n=1 Tax=Sporosarcina sp. 179-K 3D1 HS TaxID=3232169 RepID=UPI0039A09554